MATRHQTHGGHWVLRAFCGNLTPWIQQSLSQITQTRWCSSTQQAASSNASPRWLVGFQSSKFADCSILMMLCSLQWRHNGPDSVSNHQPHECLLSRLIRRRSKKTLKLRVTGLCAGISPETGELPAQRASNAENVSIWWRHHVLEKSEYCSSTTVMTVRRSVTVLIMKAIPDMLPWKWQKYILRSSVPVLCGIHLCAYVQYGWLCTTTTGPPSVDGTTTGLDLYNLEVFLDAYSRKSPDHQSPNFRVEMEKQFTPKDSIFPVGPSQLLSPLCPLQT